MSVIHPTILLVFAVPLAILSAPVSGTVWRVAPSDAAFSNCEISGNLPYYPGVGLHAIDSSPVFIGSTFEVNEEGGIVLEGAGLGPFASCLFENNRITEFFFEGEGEGEITSNFDWSKAREFGGLVRLPRLDLDQGSSIRHRSVATAG